MRHGYKHGRSGNPWPYAAVGVAVIVGVIVWLGPRSSAAIAPITPIASIAPNATATAAAAADAVPTAVTKIIEQRCVMCHGVQVQMKNVRLDTAGNLQKNKAMVYQQVVMTQQMPMNNTTGITPEERQVIAAWAKP